MRPNIKIKHTENSFSDHFHGVLLEKKSQDLKRGKGYWILNNALLDNKEYKNAIIKLWNNWGSQKHCFHSVSKWRERGRNHIKDFTKLYTRATIEKQNKWKASLGKRLPNIYRKIDTKPELKQTAQNLRTQLYNIELKEAQGAKNRSRLQYELQGERCTNFFFQQMEKRKNAKQDMLSIKRISNGKLGFYGRNSTIPINGGQEACKQGEMLWKLSKTASRQNREICEK